MDDCRADVQLEIVPLEGQVEGTLVERSRVAAREAVDAALEGLLAHEAHAREVIQVVDITRQSATQPQAPAAAASANPGPHHARAEQRHVEKLCRRRRLVAEDIIIGSRWRGRRCSDRQHYPGHLADKQDGRHVGRRIDRVDLQASHQLMARRERRGTDLPPDNEAPLPRASGAVAGVAAPKVVARGPWRLGLAYSDALVAVAHRVPSAQLKGSAHQRRCCHSSHRHWRLPPPPPSPLPLPASWTMWRARFGHGPRPACVGSGSATQSTAPKGYGGLRQSRRCAMRPHGRPAFLKGQTHLPRVDRCARPVASTSHPLPCRLELATQSECVWAGPSRRPVLRWRAPLLQQLEHWAWRLGWW